jgi:hypothetical protein
MVPKIWASFAGVVLCTILLVNYRAGPVSLDDYKDSLSNSGSDATRLLAEEAGLKFDAEDNIVKSHLSRHKPIDEVLGDLSTPNFEHKEVSQRLVVEYLLVLTKNFFCSYPADS